MCIRDRYMVPYLVIGYDILKKALKGIRTRQVFDENFLMAVATIGAIALGDYQEGTAVMLFYQIGELFQSYAVGKSRRNISELMDIRPDYANIEQDGKLEKVDPDEVEVGTIIVVQPGEKIPIDGMIEMCIRDRFEDGQEPKAVMQEVLKNCKKVEDDCEISL